MAMKRCPDCGEKYSDSYKYCPFCEEEEALRQGAQIRRASHRGGKRVAGRGRQPNLLSPILVVLIILMACLLIYLLFGDKIAEKLGGKEDPVTPPTEDVTPEAPDIGGEEPEPDGTMPEDGNTEEPNDGVGDGSQTIDPATLPQTLTVKYMGGTKTEFTMAVGDTPIPLTASGGSGSYTWSGSDDGVASVDADGKVTAVSAGRAVLTVHDGTGRGSCTVIVKAGAGSQTGSASASGSGGENKLNREDMTLSVDEKFQLKLSGVTTALSWASADTGVASVAADGTVTGIAPGKTTITVSWDGASKSCIVYVKR